MFGAENNLRGIFDEAFAAKKANFADIIRNERGDVVGGVQYQLGTIEDRICFLINYEFMREDYRQYGVSVLLAYRLAFALQLLYPQYKIWIYFTAAHYNAVRRVENMLAGPKYQPNWDNENEQFLKQALSDLEILFGYKYEFCFDREKQLFYVIEKVWVYGPTQSRSPTIQEEYYQGLRGSTDKKLHHVLYVIPVGHESVLELQKILARIQIDFIEQLFLLVEVIKKSRFLDSTFMPVESNNKQLGFLNSPLLFFNNQRKWQITFPENMVEKIPKATVARCRY